MWPSGGCVKRLRTDSTEITEEDASDIIEAYGRGTAIPTLASHYEVGNKRIYGVLRRDSRAIGGYRSRGSPHQPAAQPQQQFQRAPQQQQQQPQQQQTPPHQYQLQQQQQKNIPEEGGYNFDAMITRLDAFTDMVDSRRS